ncbi:MAG: DpnI domain-containing protein [Candidatus Dojkabacteria bacterium]|jgi:hypothetical protein
MSNTTQEFIRTNRIIGDEGEKDVIKKIKCPNCGKELMLLPPNFPLCDIQCTACQFRAQIKTNRTKPHNIIFGAGWNIVDKVLKSGYLMPPLITNFIWENHGEQMQEIRLYPFVTKKSLIVRTAHITEGNRNHKMFNYNLKDLPFLVLYTNQD